MIDDPEIRALFQSESQEKINSLRNGFLSLENLFNLDLIHLLFRDAHSLKGSARMLHLTEIETHAHQIETLLDQSRKTNQKLSENDFQQLHASLDVIERLVFHAIKDTAVSTAPPLSSSLRVSSNLVNILMDEAADLTKSKEDYHDLVEKIDHTRETLDQHLQTFKYHDENIDLGEEQIFLSELDASLGVLRQEAVEDFSNLDRLTHLFSDHIQQLGRIPLSKLFELFPLTIEEIAKAEKKNVRMETKGGDISIDKRILDELKDLVMHAIRNSIVHGIESPDERLEKGKSPQGVIRLEAEQISDQLRIEIIDDGEGVNLEKVKQKLIEKKMVEPHLIEFLTEEKLYSFLFLPGFSTATHTTDLAGRGVGMDVIKRQVESLGGSVEIRSVPHQGCCLTLQLPTKVMTTSVFMVEIGIGSFCLPTEAIDKVLSLPELADPTTFSLEEVILGEKVDENSHRIAIKIKIGENFAIFPALSIGEEQLVVIHPFKELLLLYPWCSGAAIIKGSKVSLILNPFFLTESVKKGHKKTILYAEDSSSIRLYYQDQMEKMGYVVISVENGREALSQLNEHKIDAIVSDMNMPEMDGFDLLAAVKKDPHHRNLPFIFLTSCESYELKMKALKLGVDEYLVKDSESIERLKTELKIRLSE